MADSLDEEYFAWLYSQVGSVKLRNRSRSHWELLRQLHNKEFVWLIANDDNRVEDGRDLRHSFMDEFGINADLDAFGFGSGCSMLEMLIGLARRLAFEAEGEPRVWFWHLIEIMDLEQYNDREYDENSRRRIDEVLDRVIYRTYHRSGRGGLFPLRRAAEDQRDVEIWYQANAYLMQQMI